jgi:nucleoside-diphosphate-sugar epimerase
VTKKSVVITGAAGFIASQLADRCLELGWRVVGIDAFTSYYPEALKRANVLAAQADANYTLIEGDLASLELDPILDGADYVFHLAAQAGVRASWDDFQLYSRRNVDATQRLLQACRTSNAERVVIASSSSIYGDAETLPTPEDVIPQPVSPYGATKVTTEHLARIYWRSFGVPTVCLRYFTVYGPRQRPDMAFNRMIDSALNEKPFMVFGDGNQTRDFTYVGDIVSGTLAAGERGREGATYNLGGGSRRTMNSVFETLEELLGQPFERVYIEAQRGDAQDTAADISRARAELGFEPSLAFRSGLAAQLEWQRSTAGA